MVLDRLTAKHEHQGLRRDSSIPGRRPFLFIPVGHRHLLGKPGLQSLLAGVRHLYFLVYTRSSVIPCLCQGETIHTSGRGVGSASSAGTLQGNDSWAVCGTGAWASSIHAAAKVLDSGFPPLDSSPGCPIPWEAVLHGSRQQIQDGQHRSPASCQDEWHGAAGRSDLAYILQRPLLLFQDQSIVQAQRAIQRRIFG